MKSNASGCTRPECTGGDGGVDVVDVVVAAAGELTSCRVLPAPSRDAKEEQAGMAEAERGHDASDEVRHRGDPPPPPPPPPDPRTTIHLPLFPSQIIYIFLHLSLPS